MVSPESVAPSAPSATSQATPKPSPPGGGRAGSRLAGVDGLRAAAAMWVVLFHIRVFSSAHLPFAPLDFFARSGSTGVSLFLVISGFCLYVPFAGGRQSRFKVGAFFVRRARRLLPAYYVSIGLALILNLAGGGALSFGPMSFGDVLWQLGTHMTLTHTLFPSTFYALNGAYWSLGLEWQLYLALPLLIIGMRRFGIVPTLGAAVAVNVGYRLALAFVASHGAIHSALLQTVVLPNLLPGRWAEFVLGMAAAELYALGVIDRLPPIAGFAWIPMIGVAVLADRLPISHLAYGTAFAMLLVAVLRERSLVARMFSWRPLVGLGIMSYSLYLVHQPIVQAMAHVLRSDFRLGPNATFVALIGLFPVILAAAWALFVLVERYTLTSKPVEVRGVISAFLFPQVRLARKAAPVQAETPAG